MKLPIEIITELEKAADGLNYGSACLLIKKHEGRPTYIIKTETSFIPGKPTSGSTGVIYE